MPSITMPRTLSASKIVDKGFEKLHSFLFRQGGVCKLVWGVLWAPRLILVSTIAAKELLLYAPPTLIIAGVNLLTGRKIQPLKSAAEFISKSYVEIAQLWVRSAIVSALSALAGISALALLIHFAAVKVGLVQQTNISIGDLLEHFGIRIGGGQNLIAIPIHQAKGVDKNYQDHISEVTKRGIKEILKDDVLSGYLTTGEKDEEETGKERILACYSDVLIGLANYVQLLEIEGENKCPERFTDRSRIPFNGRKKEIQEIQEELKKLHNTTQLKEALIKVNIDILKEEQKDIAKRIVALAGNLHQGDLMKAFVELNLVEMGRTAGENVFLKAYQDVVKEYSDSNN